MDAEVFTHDNTEGYDSEDLAVLNQAFANLALGFPNEDEDRATQEVFQYVKEQLLFHFDQGKRGDDLVAFYYEP